MEFSEKKLLLVKHQEKKKREAKLNEIANFLKELPPDDLRDLLRTIEFNEKTIGDILNHWPHK